MRTCFNGASRSGAHMNAVTARGGEKTAAGAIVAQQRDPVHAPERRGLLVPKGVVHGGWFLGEP